MNRPADINGAPIVMGKWYWAKSRNGRVAGTGKFAAIISRPDDISFFINGTGYMPDAFEYVETHEPSFEAVPPNECRCCGCDRDACVCYGDIA